MKMWHPIFLGLLLLCVATARSPRASSGNGDPHTLQAAIDNASPGSTITLPGGTFTWTTGVVVKKWVKIRGDNTELRNATGSGDWHATLFSLTPSAQGSIELSDIRFLKADTVGQHVTVTPGSGQPVIVHDCYFGWTGSGRRLEWQTNGGLIYNCDFVSEDKADNSAIAFKNASSDSAWHESSTLGMLDRDGTKNTYVEDCTFKDVFLQAFDFDDNSRAVIRHCTFNDSGGTSHGQDTSPVGMRQAELYENTFTFALGGNCNPNPYPLNINYWYYVRGGTGVIFNNVMPNPSSCAWGNKPSVSLTVYNISRTGTVPCQTSWPAARQVGQGSDAQGRQITDPLYIWGNSGGSNANKPALIQYSPDDCGNGLKVSDFLIEGRDYILGQAKPGYSPFTYPHPLRGGAGPGPTPTPQPSATPTPPLPTPTVTPQPTVTPSPSPGADSYSNWLDQLGRWIHDHPAIPD